MSVIRLSDDVFGLSIDELVTEGDAHRFEVVLIELKDALEAVDAQVHREEHGHVDAHCDPDTCNTYLKLVLSLLRVHPKDPRIEDRVEKE